MPDQVSIPPVMRRQGRARKKLSGQAALVVTARTGWATLPTRTDGLAPREGPDIILAAGTQAPSAFDHVTRAHAR